MSSMSTSAARGAGQRDADPADASVQRAGALEKHARFAEATAEYAAWLGSLLPSDRGGPGQRNWRVRCVAKACELLYAKTGRATGNAVLKMIGFGSSTDVSTDVRDWIENAAPRRDTWLQLSPMLGSEALRETVEGALMQIFGTAQLEARRVAQAELEGQRALVDEERNQARLEVARALAARDAAMDTAAAFERERDQHAVARQQAEAQSARLQGQLDEGEQALAASVARERELGVDLQRVQSKTTEAIKQLKDASDRYSAEITRLEGDQRRLLRDVEEARQERDHLRKDLGTRVAEVATLSHRNAELAAEAARASARAAVAEARSLDLESQDRERQAALHQAAQALAAAQADLAQERAARGAREQMILAVQREAARGPAVKQILRARSGVVVVDGDVLPRMEIQVAGDPITPRFDSVSQLEAHCASDLAKLLAEAHDRAAPR